MTKIREALSSKNTI